MEPLRTLSSYAAQVAYEAIAIAKESDALDDIARTLWRGFVEGSICEEDAEFLASFIERRRPPKRTSASGHLKQFGGSVQRLAARIGSRFKPRQPQRSPDRQASRERRRMLGGS